MKKAFWVVFLTMTMTMCANTMAAAILQKQTTGTSGNLCHYSDGSVVNVKYLSCPSFSSPENSGSNSSNNSQITNELIMREQLRLGQEAANMLQRSGGSSGWVGKIAENLKNKKHQKELKKILKDHPNYESIIRDPDYLMFMEIAGQEVTTQYILAHSPEEINASLYLYKVKKLGDNNSKFKSWAKSNTDIREFKKAHQRGVEAISAFYREVLRKWKAFNYSNMNKSSSNSNLNKEEGSEVLTHSQPDTHFEQSYAVRVADCILKDKADYMSLDWYHENHLRLFTEKFYEIEQIRDKLVFQAPTQKREKELLKKIGHSKTNALRFLTHAQETGKERHQELLLNLLACNGE